MKKARPDTSVLENCRISFIGAGAQNDNYLTRAIIELSGDIAPAMPHLHRAIEHCEFNPGTKIMAFRFHNMPVVVGSGTITINNMSDLAAVQAFLDWLKMKMTETTHGETSA